MSSSLPPPKIFMNMGAGTADADPRPVHWFVWVWVIVFVAFGAFAVLLYLLGTGAI